MVAAGSSAVHAQQAAAPAPAEAAQTIVVKGIRATLESSLNLKRDAQGLVDGISAEDIGKFPDTNLAESLQRISGVSIDRSIGEGSRVTVRGVGPDFNIVLLNGRQMPASSIADTSASNSRAFDFGNLASEAVAGIEVYKTGRAASPMGGLGGTINIKTARPLENPGQRGSFGIKGVVDTSNSRLPSTMAGNEFTPELSGIYSNTSTDGKFGIALSASYQERDLGYNQAAVGGGWIVSRGNAGALANAGNANPADITNKPDPTDLYSLPQNLIYSVNGVKRQRSNGQLTLQYAPMKNLTATLDFTYSELKLQNKRNELSAWFDFGPSSSSWTDGPIASPRFYSETRGPGNSPLRNGLGDVAMAGAEYATRNENKSTGLNVAWKFSDRLKFEFDVHSSTATSGADSPYGSNAVLGTASFNRGTTAVDFTRDFPVLSIYNSDINPALMTVTGSSFRNSYMKSAVDQAQLKGQYKTADDSKLDFGLSLNKVKNRTAFSNVQQDDWGGGQSNPADYPDSVWRADQIRPYFSQISGSGNPSLYNQFFTWDFNTVRSLASAARAAKDAAAVATAGGDAAAQAAAAAAARALFLPSSVFTTDSRVVEKSQSAYLQYVKDWDVRFPVRSAIGVRYESTDVTSMALVPVALGIDWSAANEYPVRFAAGPGFTTLKGSYKNLLPSIDVDVDVRDDMKFRASYGETIGRPLWNDIQGGQTLNALTRIDGGTGQQGNPALKPLKSKNFDLSFEWYYAKGSYAAVGLFRKDIKNYIGLTQINATPFNLRTPVKGLFWNEAVAASCASEDPLCIRDYIFAKYDGQFGVNKTTGVIPGQPGDPIANFRINAPANQKSASLDGVELNVQHMLGNTGFGMSANYTVVNSGLKYDNNSIGDQFALEGLSDTANLVVFYENDKWQVRAAYNWRGKFLSGRFDGKGPNPVYTEAYGQLDINASYKLTERLTVHAEVINANDGVQRLYGRAKEQALYVTQTGPRYMFGANYRF
ncbi:MAG: TonB-dependent receptor [Leptothrix sp. (in: Bacteria)]|nr:TonB-dependent receptor [Leptothrix sp. (in: b-proteobacteria)]